MIYRIFKNCGKFIVFSNIFIALCAVVMSMHTSEYFSLIHNYYYYFFLFFATLTSYSLHWMLTNESELIYHTRKSWFMQYKKIYPILLAISLPCTVYYLFLIKEHLIPILFCCFLSFLYTAPKINHPIFHFLRKMAIGKTIFLTAVWTYATSILPIIINNDPWTLKVLLFIFIKLFLIYAICIVFDWRDRELDSQTGINTLSNKFNLKQLQYFLLVIIFIGIIACTLFYFYFDDLKLFIFNILSYCILLLSIKYIKKSANDMIYYFVLDGLMALSSLLYLIFNYFNI